MKWCVIGLVAAGGLLQVGGVRAADGPASQPAVDVAALVREVRGKDVWLLDADAFRVRATCTNSQSPQAIEEERQELRREFPGTAITTDRFPQLLAQWTDTLDLAFTKKRFFFDKKDLPDFERTCVYDGGKTFTHDVDRSRKRDEYRVSASTDGCDYSRWALRWPRGDFRTAWCDKAAATSPTGEATPDDFGLIRTENVEGVECYVLGLHGLNLERWCVGVQDHRLHRIERGNLVTDQEMLDAARDAAKADGVELEVVDDIRPWLDGLPEAKAEAVKLACVWKVYATCKAVFQDNFRDYREIAPGCWYPFVQEAITLGRRLRGGKPVKEDVEHPWIRSQADIRVTEAVVNPVLPEGIFQMAIPEGAVVREATGPASQRAGGAQPTNLLKEQ